jgi:hypothetical protein
MLYPAGEILVKFSYYFLDSSCGAQYKRGQVVPGMGDTTHTFTEGGREMELFIEDWDKGLWGGFSAYTHRCKECTRRPWFGDWSAMYRTRSVFGWGFRREDTWGEWTISLGWFQLRFTPSATLDKQEEILEQRERTWFKREMRKIRKAARRARRKAA